MLVGDLLDYANPRPNQVVEFDLGGLVEETLRVARGEQGLGEVELASDVDQPLPIVADPAKLRQVVWNLVRNAADAAAAGGKHVRVEARRVDGGARITVADDGPGIAKELVARIFDPFVTTKQKGTGLGLAICQRIVKNHGGVITVQSRSGEGSTFIVRLPALATEAAAPETPLPEGTTLPASLPAPVPVSAEERKARRDKKTKRKVG